MFNQSVDFSILNQSRTLWLEIFQVYMNVLLFTMVVTGAQLNCRQQDMQVFQDEADEMDIDTDPQRGH